MMAELLEILQWNQSPALKSIINQDVINATEYTISVRKVNYDFTKQWFHPALILRTAHRTAVWNAGND